MQGGKARLVHVNEQVREFIRSAQRVAENPIPYSATDNDLESLLLTLCKEMTPGEQKLVMSLLLREGSPGYSTDWVSAIGESMMKLKDKMTPAELAECLNLARQTINRWAREQNWRTEAIPGVKGGRARLIVIDKAVIDFWQISRRCGI